MKKTRKSLLIFLCTVLAVVTVIFFIYRWREQVKGSNSRPVISCPDYPLRVSVSAINNNELLLQDVTASDMEDGDITDSIVVESISQFVEPGHQDTGCVEFQETQRTVHHFHPFPARPGFDRIEERVDHRVVVDEIHESEPGVIDSHLLVILVVDDARDPADDATAFIEG